MAHTLDQSRAATALASLATYMRAVKLAGAVEVLDEDLGYCLGVNLERLSPEILQLVPPKMDGLTVRVLL